MPSTRTILLILVSSGILLISTSISYYFSDPDPSLLGLVAISALGIINYFLTRTQNKFEKIIEESENDSKTQEFYSRFWPEKQRDYLHDVFVISANNYDNFFTVAREIEPNREMVAQQQTQCPGGSGANTAYLLGRLGRQVALCGALGTRPPGDALQRDLDVARIDTTLLTRYDERPGETVVLVDKSGRRFICISPGANLRAGESLENNLNRVIEQANNSAFVHISSLVQEHRMSEDGKGATNVLPVMETLLKSLSDIPILSFVPGDLHSVAGSSNKYNELLLSRADIVFFYEHQLMYLLDGTTEKECTTERLLNLIERFLAFRSKLTSRTPVLLCIKRPEVQPSGHSHPMDIMVVLGTEKIIERWDRSTSIPAGPPYLDGTGAGDAAAAGLIDSLLRREAIPDAASNGAELSSFIASEIGSRVGIEAYLSFRKKRT